MSGPSEVPGPGTASTVAVGAIGTVGRLGLAPPNWTTVVSPGATAPAPVTIDAAQLQASMVAALPAPYAAAGATAPAQVVWYDHDGDVLVELSATTVSLQDGMVLVTFSLQSDQTGAGQITVPLSVGTPANPTGMLIGTEIRPRGTVQLVDRWGQAATAAAWSALLDVARTLAQQGGADANGAPFIPVSITATSAELAVLPQARQAMDVAGAS